MTLRDLTKRQLYNLRRRMEKERKEYMKRFASIVMSDIENRIWMRAYDKGLKAGLEIADQILEKRYKLLVIAAFNEKIHHKKEVASATRLHYQDQTTNKTRAKNAQGFGSSDSST